MIQNPQSGQECVFISKTGHLYKGTISSLTKEVGDYPDYVFLDIESDGIKYTRHCDSVFHLDDHDGVIKKLKQIMSNCQLHIDQTRSRKKSGKPIFTSEAELATAGS